MTPEVDCWQGACPARVAWQHVYALSCPCQYFHNKVKRWPLERGLKRFPVKTLQQENQPKPCEISIIQHPGPPFGNPSGCSGSPGWAVRGQCSPRLSALPGPAPGALAQPGCLPWVPKLGLGRLPGAASPTFSWQEGGEAESVSCCALTAAETSSQSATSGGRPGPKFSRGQGGGAQAGARAAAPDASLGVGGIYSPGPDHLTPCPLQWLSTAGAISPQKEASIFRAPKNHFLGSVLI